LFSLVPQLGGIEKQITKETNKIYYPTWIHFAEKKEDVIIYSFIFNNP